MAEPVKIDPLKIPGPWAAGFVLERRHTISSEFLGYDGAGNPRFETSRSELGELVFQLKNRGNRGAASAIATIAAGFVREWNPRFDRIVPIPPSRKRMNYQPVAEITSALGGKLAKPVRPDAVKKTRPTPQLKDVFDLRERTKLLEGAFEVDRATVSGKNILLVDDLFRSGATAKVVTRALLASGAAAVYMLAITKTRTRT